MKPNIVPQRFGFLAGALLATLVAVSANAQHPIDIERGAAQGEYLKALADYDKMPKRIATSASSLAAAKSAWALSLPERATLEFDALLKDKTLNVSQRAQIFLSRGIIEYQEGRPQVAILYAEKAERNCEAAVSCGLKPKIRLLWGESLAELGSYGAAETKLIEAREGAGVQDKIEIAYRLGMCRLRLGKLADARGDFEQIPLNHERTPEAIRYLASIALDSGAYANAGFWLAKGRDEYPDSFLDSWVDYALLQVAVNTQDKKAVREIRVAATKKYPPSDPWFTLLDASAEAFEWTEARAQ